MIDAAGLKRFLVMISGTSTKLGRLAGDFSTYEKAVFYIAKNIDGEDWFIWDLTETSTVTDLEAMEA